VWWGTHPAGPTLVQPEGVDLQTLIRSAPSSFLGPSLVRAWPDRLPFLVKLLAASAPLSIQVHPNLEQARLGYAAEQSSAASAPGAERNYKDDNHKPELIFALTRFCAVVGFESPGKILERFSSFGLADPNLEVFALWQRLRTSPDGVGLRRFFAELFHLSPDGLERAIALAVARASSTELADEPLAYWLRRAAGQYRADPGVLALLMMNYVELAPGEALFLSAGKLHAYLDGFGVEVMASSDNVLRGGLTSKRVDVPELCRIVSFEPSGPSRVLPLVSSEPGEGRLSRFRTEATEFELNLLELDSEGRRIEGPAIVICLGGRIEVSAVGEAQSAVPLTLPQGEAAFVSASEPARIAGAGRVALVSVPQLAAIDS
jgi:mannose-6-phosphate isomerase